MIYLLYGENYYFKRQQLAKLLKDSSKDSLERHEGDELEPADLAQIFGGMSLFTTKKTIVIRNIAQNKNAWETLANYAAEAQDNDVIFLEDSIDKRTKIYKLLQKNHTVIECAELSEPEMLQWLEKIGAKENSSFTSAHAKLLLDRVGCHQMKLYYALQKVLLLKKIDTVSIERVIDDEPEARAFTLIEAIMTQNQNLATKCLRDVKASEDAHMFFGLMVSQFFLLITLASARNNSYTSVAKNLGTHPYPLQKMSLVAKNLPHQTADAIIDILTKTDEYLKHSSGDAWVAVEQCIQKLLHVTKD